MTTTSISAASPIMSASAMKNMVGAPEAAPDARLALNASRENGPSSIRTGLQIIPSPTNAEAALKSSSSQIARLQSDPGQPTARAASEAYLTQAGARTAVTLQEKTARSQNVNLTA